MTRTTIENQIQQYITLSDISCEKEIRPKFCTYKHYDVICPMYDTEGMMCLRNPLQIIKPNITYKK